MLKLFTNQEIMIMATVVIGLLIVIFTLSLLDIRDKAKNKKKVSIVENEKKEEEKENLSVPPKGSVSEVLEEIEIIDDEDDFIEVIEKEDPFYSPIEEIEINKKETLTEQEAAKEELKRVRLELEQAEVQKEQTLEDTIRLYEAEQEDKAVISLDELTKISDKAYENNELRGYEDDIAPISLDEVINHYSTNNMEFENTATYAKLVHEENKQEDFLTQLKNTYHEHEN